MVDFKVGDEVVCVDVGPSKDCSNWVGGLAKGQIYTVWGVTSYQDFYGDYGVALHELDAPQGDLPVHLQFFASWRFRKVQKRDSSLSIESFLTIKPGYEEPRRKPSRKRVKA